MKGETSLPYFCACADHEFGRRRAFDVAVQFRFQRHACIPVSPRRPTERGLNTAPGTIAPRISIGYGPAGFELVTKMSEQRTTAAGGMETSYGFRSVGAGEKQPLVNDVFHKVANRYDLMNDLMSGGLHRLWKDAHGRLAQSAEARRAGSVLDVAGGTGDIAFRIVEASHGNAHATVLDINGSMLARRPRARRKEGLADKVDFVEANAEELPFADETLRRLHDRLRHPQRAAHRGGACRSLSRAEARRPLPCLEFSEVDMPLLDRVYEAWSFNAIPRIGKTGGRRRRALFLSGRIDPQIPQPGEFRRHDPARRLRPRHLSQLFRRHRGAAFGLEALTDASA